MYSLTHAPVERKKIGAPRQERHEPMYHLSNRVEPDGSLTFEDEDHSYGGGLDTRAVPGDPLPVLRELAHQVRQHGISAARGSVIVDARQALQASRSRTTPGRW